jgi:hypothetical protein
MRVACSLQFKQPTAHGPSLNLHGVDLRRLSSAFLATSLLRSSLSSQFFYASLFFVPRSRASSNLANEARPGA